MVTIRVSESRNCLELIQCGSDRGPAPLLGITARLYLVIIMLVL